MMPDLPVLYRPSVTRHAIERYQQRIAPAPAETIVAHILCPFIAFWIARGATCVRGHAGLNVYAKAGAVVTITPAEWKPNHHRRPLSPKGRGRHA